MAMYPRIPLLSIIRNDLYIPKERFNDAFYFPDDDMRNDFINYFLLEYGEFTPVYQQPEFLLTHIQAVSKSLKYTIDKLYATLSLEYNPIENYDRHENWTDTRTPDLNTDRTSGKQTDFQGGHTTTFSGGETETRQPHDIERKVSADNTGDYFPSEKTIEDEDSRTTTYNNRSDTDTYNNRRDVEAGLENEQLTGTDENAHVGRVHGNIGVTTSQQMVLSEREDVSYYNFIDDVARLYGEKLCIMIY